MGLGLGLDLRLGGGGFLPFNVLSLSPALWLDASDLSTLFTDAAATTPATSNGDNIGAWRDKSGNARHFTQSGATRPTLSLTSGISFTGGQNLDSASNSMITSGNQDFTILAVYEPNLATDTYGFVFGNVTAGLFALYMDNRVASVLKPFGVANPGVLDLSSDSYSTGVKCVTVQRLSGSFTGWQGTTQKNTVANTSSVYSGAGTASVWSLGANTANGEALEGWIRELIVIDSAISAGSLLAVQNYLIGKHGAS